MSCRTLQFQLLLHAVPLNNIYHATREKTRKILWFLTNAANEGSDPCLAFAASPSEAAECHQLLSRCILITAPATAEKSTQREIDLSLI